MRYSNVEYDIVTLAKDQRVPGVTCEGQLLVTSFVEEPKPILKDGN